MKTKSLQKLLNVLRFIDLCISRRGISRNCWCGVEDVRIPLKLLKLARKQLKHEIERSKFGLVPIDWNKIVFTKTSGWENDYKFLYIIVHSKASGRKCRYHVLKLDRQNATIDVLGNEIDLPLAKEIIVKKTKKCKYE